MRTSLGRESAERSIRHIQRVSNVRPEKYVVMRLVLDALFVRRTARLAYFHLSTRGHIAHKRMSQRSNFVKWNCHCLTLLPYTVKLMR